MGLLIAMITNFHITLRITVRGFSIGIRPVRSRYFHPFTHTSFVS